MQPAAQLDHWEAAVQLRELLGAEALLETEETNAGNPGDRLELLELERALTVFLVVRVALPRDADLESVDPADLISPRRVQLWFGGQVGHLGRHGFECRLQDVGKA